MSKVMKCQDIGFDCKFVATGESEDQVMSQVVEHAQKVHGLDDVPEDVALKVKAAIHDE